jgi:hypothetical protein
MRRTRPARIVAGAILGLAGGLVMAWVDTRPGWDDAGVTAGGLMLAAALAAGVGAPAWLAAALVAGPIVLAQRSGGAGIVVVIPLALAGALAGALVRRWLPGRWEADATEEGERR